MPRKLFLIDGSNHAFRVFHAMPRMSTAGQPTGALLGFANMLRMLEDRHSPDLVVCAFDVGRSFRVELYPDYKGHRPEMDPELRAQWPLFQDLVEAWGHTYLAGGGLEADDIIGTLARQMAGPEMEVWIVSGDKDFAQLVGPHVRLLDVMKNRILGPDEVVERFRVPVDKIVDMMGLWGDSSDNVPGVPGIGEKTSSKLINQYGSMDALLAGADKIRGKRGENLRNFADQARLSRTLVTIKTDAELTVTPADIEATARDVPRLRQLFLAWQFRTHLSQLMDPDGAPAIDRSGYRRVLTREALDEVIAKIRAAGRLSFDTETTSLDPLEATLVGLCLCWGEKSEDAAYVPVGHVDGLGNRLEQQLTEAEVMAALAPLLADPALPKLGQNLKYDLRVLSKNGYALEGIRADTMLQDYLLEPDRSKHGLDDLSLRYLGHKMIAYAEALGADPKKVPFSYAPLERACEYGAEDAHVCWLLDALLDERVEAEGLRALLDTVELPLVPVLARMERAGIGVDLDALGALQVEFAGRISAIAQRVYDAAGREFNIASTKQLQKLLFEDLGLVPTKKTKKGTGFSTDAATLASLRAQHPIPGMILDYRSLAKLQSTYVEALPRFISPVTGRIHTSFHQAVAATGRLSSNDPNLQNIPARTEEGRRIRRCFTAKPGHVFLSCDYSQVELRLLAHYCGAGPLFEAFRAGEDIHRRTAAEVFEITPEQVTREQRSAAKAINFGIIYGMSAFRLAAQLGIGNRQAQTYIDGYFARAPQVKRVIDGFIESAKADGVAITLWGRKRPVPAIRSRNPREAAAAERIAMNTPIQGSAADLMKKAMIAVDLRLRAEMPQATLLLQVHDELVLEVPEADVEAAARLVTEEMEGAAELKIPLKVDSGWGRTWDEAH